MNISQIAANPFALMMDPEAVFAALASSDRLTRLKSRVCRPLDKPAVVRADGTAAEPAEPMESGDEMTE